MAIVLWPTRARLPLLGLSAAFGLLQSAIDGNADALSGFADLPTMHAEIERIDTGWTPELRSMMLGFLDNDRFSLDSCLLSMRRVVLSDMASSTCASRVRHLVVRHGVGPLRERLLQLFAASPAAGDSLMAHCHKGWAALKGLLDVANKPRRSKRPSVARTSASRKSAPIDNAGVRAPTTMDSFLQDLDEGSVDGMVLDGATKEAERQRIARLRDRVNADTFQTALRQVLTAEDARLNSAAEEPLSHRLLGRRMEEALGLEVDDLHSPVEGCEERWDSCLIFDGLFLYTEGGPEEAPCDVQDAISRALKDSRIEVYDVRRGGSGCTSLDDLHQARTGQLVGGPAGAHALFLTLAKSLISLLSNPPPISHIVSPIKPATELGEVFKVLLHLESDDLLRQATQAVIANKRCFPPLTTAAPLIATIDGMLQSHKPKAPKSARDCYVASKLPSATQRFERAGQRKEQASKLATAEAEREWQHLPPITKAPWEAQADASKRRFDEEMKAFKPRECPRHAELSRTLAESLASALAEDSSSPPLTTELLTDLVRTLLDAGVVASRWLPALASKHHPLVSSTAGLMATSPNHRAAILAEPTWPPSLLTSFRHASFRLLTSSHLAPTHHPSSHASGMASNERSGDGFIPTSINLGPLTGFDFRSGSRGRGYYSKASSATASVAAPAGNNVERKDLLESMFKLLAEFDCGSRPSDTSTGATYREQLTTALLRPELRATYVNVDVLAPMLEPLYESLDVKARMTPWFRSLLTAATDEMTRHISPEPPKIPTYVPQPAVGNGGKDWSIKVPPGTCTCAICKDAITFLASPTVASKNYGGVNATYSGHLTTSMQAAAKKFGSAGGKSFAVHVMSSKAARVHGSMRIIKTVPGALTPEAIQSKQAEERRRKSSHDEKVRVRNVAVEKRNRELAKLAALEQLQAKLSELQAETPSDVFKFGRLLEAARRSDAAANAAIAAELAEEGKANESGSLSARHSSGAAGAAAAESFGALARRDESTWSVGEMKAALAESGISLQGVTEKEELRALVRERLGPSSVAAEAGAAHVSPDAAPPFGSPSWVASHFPIGAIAAAAGAKGKAPPLDARAHVAATAEEEELNGEVLLSMSFEELREVLLVQGGEMATPSNQQSWFIGLKHLWLALRRREAGGRRSACVSADEVAAWLLQLSRLLPEDEQRALRSIGFEEEVPTLLRRVQLDGNALASLSEDEWSALSAALLGGQSHMHSLCTTAWQHLKPLAAAMAAHPARDVTFLPLPIERPFTVVVAGGTGAGKSTLVNSLLGTELLPTSCMRACTAAVIEVTWPRLDGATYEAEVALISAAAWRVVVEEACTAASKAGAGTVPSEKEDPTGHVAYAKAVSFYGRDIDLVTTPIDELMARASEVEGLGSARTLAAASESELAQCVRPYVDSSDDVESGALWPLIARVTLRAPFPVTAAGVRVYDVPGLHDDNAARDGVMAGILSEADSLLIVSNIRRACNDKGAKDLLSLPLRRALLTSGFLGEVAFVATQSDIFTPSEIVDNLGLPAETGLLDCALARNEFTKAYLTKSLYRALEPALLPANRPPPAAWHQLGFELPIFTVSASDYQLSAHGANAADGPPRVYSDPVLTEIPALTSYLSFASAAHHRRELDGMQPSGSAAGGEHRRVGAVLLDCIAKAAHEASSRDAAAASGSAPVGAPATVGGGSGGTSSTSTSTEADAAQKRKRAEADIAQRQAQEALQRAALVRAEADAGQKRAASDAAQSQHFKALVQAADEALRARAASLTSSTSSLKRSEPAGPAKKEQPPPKKAKAPPPAVETIDLCDSD